MAYRTIFDDKEIFSLKNKCKVVQQRIHTIVESIPVGNNLKKEESTPPVGSINYTEGMVGLGRVESEGNCAEKNSKSN